ARARRSGKARNLSAFRSWRVDRYISSTATRKTAMPGKRTATITLDGDSYTVHAFNVGELQQLAGILADDNVQASARSFTILKMALLRANPSVGDFDSLEPTLDEVMDASKVIMELAGLKATANPQQTAATPAA